MGESSVGGVCPVCPMSIRDPFAWSSHHLGGQVCFFPPLYCALSIILVVQCGTTVDICM